MGYRKAPKIRFRPEWLRSLCWCLSCTKSLIRIHESLTTFSFILMPDLAILFLGFFSDTDISIFQAHPSKTLYITQSTSMLNRAQRLPLHPPHHRPPPIIASTESSSASSGNGWHDTMISISARETSSKIQVWMKSRSHSPNCLQVLLTLSSQLVYHPTIRARSRMYYSQDQLPPGRKMLVRMYLLTRTEFTMLYVATSLTLQGCQNWNFRCCAP